MFSKERFKRSWDRAPRVTMLFFVIPMLVITLFAGILFGNTLRDVAKIFTIGAAAVFLFSYGLFLFRAFMMGFKKREGK